jgi:ribonucleoside-diphosphate reductase beta chain
MGEDVKDWHTKLNASERRFLTQILRFFVQSDIDVHKVYEVSYSQVFKPTEVRMALSCIASMESIHIAAYSHVIETIGMPDSEYLEFLKCKEMVNKHEFNKASSCFSNEKTLITLATFGAFVEGLQLFASFAMLLSFPANGVMNGLGQIITLSVRDESMHCKFIIDLFHALQDEMEEVSPGIKEYVKPFIYEKAAKAVALEDAFIDMAYGMDTIRNTKKEDIKQYIRYVCDARFVQLGYEPIYGIKAHPLPWLQSILNGVEFANFFETKPVDYSKDSTTGTWEEAWDDYTRERYPEKSSRVR